MFTLSINKSGFGFTDLIECEETGCFLIFMNELLHILFA